MFSKSAKWLFLIFLLTVSVPVQAEESRAVALEAARQSVVSVLPQWPGRAPDQAEPEGSGVVFGDGTTILTADHVLGPAAQNTPVLVRDHDGNVLSAKVVARSKATDIAVLKVEQALTAIAAPDGSQPKPGDDVCAIGNGFGLGLSVTCGHVSGVHKTGVGFNPIEDFIQTDAAVNPGMSGGALVDREGNLIGMLSAIFTKTSDANIGVNFAVDVRLLKRVADDLIGKGEFQPIRTGIVLRPALRKGQTGRQGTLVVRARAGSAGQKAGLEPGDVIYKVNERRIRKVQDWLSVIAGAKPGARLTVSGTRDGNDMRWQLTM